MEIDIYDFDKTLVPFDSGSLFVGYCLLHYPYIVIFLPFQAIGILLVLLGIIKFTQYKKFCYCFIPFIPLNKAVKGFWDRHEKQVFKWFYDRKRYSVIISASPDFLLEEIGNRLGFDKLICSRHSRKTGAIIGKNCHDEEKVRRLNDELDMSKVKVVDVYSDSIKNDKYIFSLGENCINIVKGKRVPFNFKDKYKD